MLTGSICAGKEDAEHLQQLGVILGEYVEEDKEFINCIVSDEALTKLDPFWYTYYWSLH